MTPRGRDESLADAEAGGSHSPRQTKDAPSWGSVHPAAFCATAGA
jgi:hypothetical protein